MGTCGWGLREVFCFVWNFAEDYTHDHKILNLKTSLINRIHFVILKMIIKLILIKKITMIFHVK